MGAIISKEGTIDSLRFSNIRVGRVANAKRILRLDKSTALIELESGAFTLTGHGSHLNGNVAIVNFGSSGPSKAVLDGLVKMGVITAAARKRHIDHIKARAKVRDANNAAYQLQKQCKELGVPMPELPEGVEAKKAYW